MIPLVGKHHHLMILTIMKFYKIFNSLTKKEGYSTTIQGCADLFNISGNSLRNKKSKYGMPIVFKQYTVTEVKMNSVS